MVAERLPVRELGRYRDTPVFLTGEAAPSFDEADDFSAVLYYNDAQQERHVEIAVIDTSHGTPHLHRNYVYGRRDRSPVGFDGGFWDALAYLEESWRRLTHEYMSNL